MSDQGPEEHKALFRALLLRRLAVGALVAALVLSNAMSLYTVVAIRTSQVTNTGTLNTTSKLLHLFVDCTDKKGSCYQRNQRQTGAIVTSVNVGAAVAAAAAAACADRPDVSGYPAIKACVLATLATDRKKH